MATFHMLPQELVDIILQYMMYTDEQICTVSLINKRMNSLTFPLFTMTPVEFAPNSQYIKVKPSALLKDRYLTHRSAVKFSLQIACHRQYLRQEYLKTMEWKKRVGVLIPSMNAVLHSSTLGFFAKRELIRAIRECISGDTHSVWDNLEVYDWAANNGSFRFVVSVGNSENDEIVVLIGI